MNRGCSRLTPRRGIGIFFCIIGIAILVPTLIARSQRHMVPGRIVDVLPQPAEDGQLALGILFEFSPRGPAYGKNDVALGWGRADGFGRPLEKKRIQPEQWPMIQGEFQAAINQGLLFQVFYKPEHPIESARIYPSHRGMWRMVWGILLLLTPLILYLSRCFAKLLHLFITRLTLRKS